MNDCSAVGECAWCGQEVGWNHLCEEYCASLEDETTPVKPVHTTPGAYDSHKVLDAVKAAAGQMPGWLSSQIA